MPGAHDRTGEHAAELEGRGSQRWGPLRHRLGVRLRARRRRTRRQSARRRAGRTARRGAAASRGGSRHGGLAEHLAGAAIGAGTGDGYVEMARGFEPPDARYLNNHRGHFVFVKPEERKFITAELIRRTTFTATEQELKQRVEALRSAGWSQLVIPITPGEERAIEDWARVKRAFD